VKTIHQFTLIFAALLLDITHTSISNTTMRNSIQRLTILLLTSHFSCRSPFWKNVALGSASWFLGAKFHSRRAVKKSSKTAALQQQKLYERYVQDVSTLKTQNMQLQEYIQATTVQQLADEFRQADTNQDNKVSRLEFEQYKRQYLKMHPEADPSMFPRFEDFDPDHNGMVTFTEHEDYYRKQGMIA